MILKTICRRQAITPIRCYHQSIHRSYNQNSQDSKIYLASDESRESRDRALKHLLENSTGFIDTKPQHDQNKWATLPYVDGTIMSSHDRNELDIDRPKIDPRDTSIIIFPGDGVQFVGMAKSLELAPAAKDLFDYASEILK